ncbi:MAG: hypothetical protein M3R24_08345 [Chloroflexota bacterium]|nr:hypothetical protein [Chloroflexota bacterium]
MPPRDHQPNETHAAPEPNKPHADAPIASSQPRQTHFWLTDEDIQFMDAVAYHLRRNGWQRATRSACMRTMIQLLQQANVDLTDVRDEAGLLCAFREALFRHP